MADQRSRSTYGGDGCEMSALVEADAIVEATSQAINTQALPILNSCLIFVGEMMS